MRKELMAITLTIHKTIIHTTSAGIIGIDALDVTTAGISRAA